MSLLYFAYGSNLHPRRLQHRADSARPAGIARLPDYRLAFHKRGADGSGKGNVVPAPGQSVWGAVYRLSASDAAVLDDIEGPGYARVTLQVARSDDAGILRVITYRAHPGAIEEGLVPFGWYLDFVLHGAAQHGLPAAYLKQLQRVVTADDTNGGRAQRERAILGRIMPLGEIKPRP